MLLAQERWLAAYYVATPLFWLAEAALGIDLRLAYLESTGMRWLYVAVCTVAGLLIWRWRRLAPFWGLAESGANILLLCLALLAPIWQATQVVSSLHGGEMPAVLSTGRLINFLISGFVCLTSFRMAERELRGMSPA